MGKQQRKHVAASAVAVGPHTDLTSATDHHVAQARGRLADTWQSTGFSADGADLRASKPVSVLQRESAVPTHRPDVEAHDPDRERRDLTLRQERYAEVRRRVLGEDVVDATAPAEPTGRNKGKEAKKKSGGARKCAWCGKAAGGEVDATDGAFYCSACWSEWREGDAAVPLEDPASADMSKLLQEMSVRDDDRRSIAVAPAGAIERRSSAAAPASEEAVRVSNLWAPALARPARAVRKADTKKADKLDPDFARGPAPPPPPSCVAASTANNERPRLSARMFMAESEAPLEPEQQVEPWCREQVVPAAKKPPPPPSSAGHEWPTL